MKLDLPKEWFEKHIRDEGDCDIGAGKPPDKVIDPEEEKDAPI